MWLRLLLMLCLVSGVAAQPAAAAPVLLRQPFQGGTVSGNPGDLILLGGSGFEPGDRVVYQAAPSDPDSAPTRPAQIPEVDSAASGTAPVVKVSDPADAITVRLPAALLPGRIYWLWVVSPSGIWSAPSRINDPRPLWFSPALVQAAADPSDEGRVLRVIGRNLGFPAAGSVQLRLQGTVTYRVRVRPASPGVAGSYVREAALPRNVVPGFYSVALSPDGRQWWTVPDQTLQVIADPAPKMSFDITDQRFGHCRPDDGIDDSSCFRKALQAALAAGGGVVLLPAGHWDLSSGSVRNGFILAPGISLKGMGAAITVVQRHDAIHAPMPGALLTVIGSNSVSGITFSDDARYHSSDDVRSIIQLGLGPAGPADPVTDVLIANNAFLRVGRGLLAAGQAIRRLTVVHNQFGAFETALMLTGSAAGPDHPYQLEDSVFRDNQFLPGSYLNVAGRQGNLASQLGASNRVDFSANSVSVSSTAGLQDAVDPVGWRGAFFWSLNNSIERLLVASNQIDCPGDKAGDGEGIALDGTYADFGFDGLLLAEASGPDWVRVRGRLAHTRAGRDLPADFYSGQWITIIDGDGLGQTRKIIAYTEDDRGTVTFRVQPGWDVAPTAGSTRVAVGRQYWQVYVLANHINQSSPTCRKANVNGPHGGAISLWAPVVDSVIVGNQQNDTDGILFLQDYSASGPSCPSCVNFTTAAANLLIQDNLVDGEYDWNSDCSWSGIRGYFVATNTPESPPPLLGFNIQISGNTVIHADGQRGGAISMARAGQSGPAPGRWPFTQNVLIVGNAISDLEGPPPRPLCRQQQTGPRTGIRIEGDGNVNDAVLSGNHCTRVSRGLQDFGTGTTRLCANSDPYSCECTQP